MREQKTSAELEIENVHEKEISMGRQTYIIPREQFARIIDEGETLINVRLEEETDSICITVDGASLPFWKIGQWPYRVGGHIGGRVQRVEEERTTKADLGREAS